MQSQPRAAAGAALTRHVRRTAPTLAALALAGCTVAHAPEAERADAAPLPSVDGGAPADAPVDAPRPRDPWDDVLDRLDDARCARALRCDGRDRGRSIDAQTACHPGLRARARAEVDRALEEGSARLDEEAVVACIDFLETLYCHQDLGRPERSRVCDAVVVGTRDVGEACDPPRAPAPPWLDPCRPGAHCLELPGCEGVCALDVPEGDRCGVTSRCEDGLVCTHGVCHAYPRTRLPGEACIEPDDCDGSSCVDGRCPIRPVVAEGDGCAPLGAECAEGTTCAEDRTCQRLPGAGAPCLEGACDRETYCDGGACVLRRRAEESCDGAGDECAEPLACVDPDGTGSRCSEAVEGLPCRLAGDLCPLADLVCVPTPWALPFFDGVCLPGAGPGDACERALDCAAGHRCVAGRCASVGTLGDACGGHAVCAHTLWCDAGRCSARALVGAACGSDAECLEGICEAGRCVWRVPRASCDPTTEERLTDCEGVCAESLCAEVVRDGELCAVDAECADGLECRPTADLPACAPRCG